MHKPFIVRGKEERHPLSFSRDLIKPIPWAEMMRQVLSVIPYPGGKAGLVPSLVPLLEWATKQYGLKAFVEATGGGGRCSININPQLFEHRVYSDIDFPLCCLFETLGDKRKTNDLIRRLYRQNYDEDVFKLAVATRSRDNQLAEEGSFSEASDLVSAAANTFVAACMSRAAGMKSYDRKSARLRREGYYQRILELPIFNDILYGTEVIRWDCRKLIQEIEDGKGRYPSSQSLIYVDPPYDPAKMRTNKHYAYSWNREDHVNFRDLIRNTNSYMVISAYASDIYNDLLKNGWSKIFLMNKAVTMGGTSRRADECVYVNFAVTDEVLSVIQFGEPSEKYWYSAD